MLVRFFSMGLLLFGLFVTRWCETASAADPAPAAGVKSGAVLVVDAGNEPAVDRRAFVRLAVPDEELAEVRLVETTGGGESPVPAQIESGEQSRLWWIVRGESGEGPRRTYRLDRGKPAESATNVSVEQTRAYVDLKVGDRQVLRYNATHVQPPEGVDPKYGRSGHIHPAMTPAGVVVTDEFPPDHLHQSGLFLAYTKTEFEGRTPNFWDLLGGTGRVRFRSLRGASGGPVFGEFLVTHEHVDLSGAAESVALLENWTVRVWNLGGLKPGYWVCDIASASQCAGTSPLVIKQYHYGGMALRGARDWPGDKGKFVTSEGKGRIEGNHSRPWWCDLTGAVGDRIAGIALFTHPANFRAPEPLRIHPTMQYMVYTPAHLGDWSIEPGRIHRSSYRFVFHDGELAKETLDQIARDFARPLEAVVSK